MSRAMKDSGIPWLGEIPSSWQVGRVKQFYSFITGFTPPSKNDSYYDIDGTPWITIGDMKGRWISQSNKGISKKYIDENNPLITPKGSLLYSFKLSVGQVALTDRAVYTNEAIASFLNKEDIDLGFLFYSSQVCIIQNANENIYGAKLLNQDLINNALIVFPPLKEQKSIADFLDKKCGEIDEMVSLQEKIVEELKAYKQSVITEAVCKGLNPDVPMKDSGIEWIDSIPSHWGKAKIQYLASLGSGTNLTTEQIEDSGTFPVYGGNGLRGYYSQYNRDGDYVLIGRQGALCGNINYASGKFWATEHAVVCHPKTAFITHWFGELLRAMNLNQYSLASAQPGLAVERIKQLSIPVPPIHEQQAIADYLTAKCGEIDALISLKQTKVDSLKEYKKSIIYEYITGKKEVEA